MKNNYNFNFLLLLSLFLFNGNVNAQCGSIVDLESFYCSDAGSASLTGVPSGGVFEGDGVSGSTFSAVDAGIGSHEVSYTLDTRTEKYYIKSNTGDPWGSTSNNDAMDLAFGIGEWTLGAYESLDVDEVFSVKTAFIFMDGSDSHASELNDFLTANRPVIEAWVEQGGKLFLNAAPNEGGDIDFGFGGSTLEYDSPASNVTVLDVNHPAYVGPNTPTATTMTGSSYSHAHITGVGFTSVLVNSTDASKVILCEKKWGAGRIMMGGMTTTNFHSPATESLNWRANIFVYLATPNRYYVRSSIAGEPWGSASNTDAMNTAFGQGNWIVAYFETVELDQLLNNNTSFIFLEGSDGNASELNDFLNANIDQIEEWVSNGGSLFMNAAPNEGGDIDFGFDGTTLVYADASSSVDVVDLAHPIYLGPFMPTAAVMTGSGYGHAHITGVDYTNILVNSADVSSVVLCEKGFGNGNIMVGGMTTANYHSPAVESQNWRANILYYMDDAFDGNICTSIQETEVLSPMVITYTSSDESIGSGGDIDITVTGGLPPYTFDWDNDGTGDFDDLEDLSGIGTGTYTVEVLDAAGCSQSEMMFIGFVGIQDTEILTVSLYPNPTNGIATIEYNGEFEFVLTSISGDVVLKGNGFDKTQFSMEGYANGVYVLDVLSNQSRESIKLIKQ
jgi:hypothetical protein